MNSTMHVEGHGSVEQLEKGKPKGKCRKWRLWVRADGKNKSRRFNGAYREALAALDEFKAEVAAVVPNSESFRAYAQSWEAWRRESGRLKPNTIAKDARHVRALSRVLGDIAMDAITPETCRDALMRIKNGENATGRRLSNTTMRLMHVYLSMILQQAEDDGRLTSNPMAKVKPPKNDTREKTALSRDELDDLLDKLDDLPVNGYSMACYLMACLGLRRGEACAMMDADFCDGIARVRYSLDESSGAIGEPKSRAGIRALPVPDRLDSKVAEWRRIRDQRGIGDAPTLACNFSGGTLLPQNLYRWWCKSSASIGCEGMTMHQLRHSNLTMMARHLSPFDLQRYAGWSSLEPARVYIHEDIRAVSQGVSEAWLDNDQGGDENGDKNPSGNA